MLELIIGIFLGIVFGATIMALVVGSARADLEAEIASLEEELRRLK